MLIDWLIIYTEGVTNRMTQWIGLLRELRAACEDAIADRCHFPIINIAYLDLIL